jgi:hypothetical protein
MGDKMLTAAPKTKGRSAVNQSMVYTTGANTKQHLRVYVEFDVLQISLASLPLGQK